MTLLKHWLTVWGGVFQSSPCISSNFYWTETAALGINLFIIVSRMFLKFGESLIVK